MSSRFQKATRKKARLRMALDGPSGSGKSYTALRFAFALAASIGPDARVAAIDTENGSLSLYQGNAPDGTPFDFDVIELTTHSPTDYTSAIEEAGREGYNVLLIDSLSHAWAGREGALELKDRQGGNSFTAWKDITPMHNRMVEAILSSPCHIIATMRSKTEYVLETNEKGKQEPRRVGMAPIQRAGMEYEFGIYGSLDWSHILTVTKSRCSAVQNAVVVKPGPEFMRPIMDWLERGQAAPLAAPQLLRTTDEQLRRISELLAAAGMDMDRARREHLRRYAVGELVDLKPDQADDLIKRLERTTRPLTAKPSLAQPPGPATAPPGTTNGSHAASATSPAEGLCRVEKTIRPDQADRLNDLARLLAGHGLTKQQFGNALKKRGAFKLAELSEAAAEELIQAMQSQLTLKEMAAAEAANAAKIERGEPVESGVEKRDRERREGEDAAREHVGAGSQPSP